MIISYECVYGMEIIASMNHMCLRCDGLSLGWKHNGLHESVYESMNSELIHLGSGTWPLEPNEH